ncbi:MAG: hypothetical protein ACQETL_10140 [Bacteroidota bacterium]
MNLFKQFFFSFLIISLVFSCDPVEEEAPLIKIQTVKNIKTSSVQIIGNIYSEGTSPVIKHGVCWSTSENPSLSDHVIEKGPLLGEFNEIIDELKPGTNYFIRAYATNNEGISYSDQISFRTLGSIPSAITTSVTEINPPSAKFAGYAKTNNNLEAIAFFEYSHSEDFRNSKISDSITITENKAVIISVNNLEVDTYYVRLVVKNDVGVALGETIQFESKFSLGTRYKGGLICYIDETGLHGLICRDTYTGYQVGGMTSYDWGPSLFYGATGTDIYDGKINTEIILDYDPNPQGFSFPAIINSYYIDGNGDWFMASRDELDIIKHNIVDEDLGDFHLGEYWSSSEVNADSVWVVNFTSGESFISTKAGYSRSAIAVSTF